jgi:LAGLIDADG-like domain
MYVEESLTTADIARRLRCGASTVRRRLHEFEIPVRGRGPQSASRHGCDPAWSPEIAWIVGLVATDGNLSKQNWGITITSKDLDLLESVRRYLSLSNVIGRSEGGVGTGVCRLQWRSRRLYEWLTGIGLTPRKSLTIGPLSVPDRFFADFFRGCIDGDGSILLYTDRYHAPKKQRYVYERLYVSLVSASRPFVAWVRSEVVRLTGALGALHEHGRRRERPVWILRYAKADSIRLLAWMYYAQDLPCLARKRSIAERFLVPLGYVPVRPVGRPRVGWTYGDGGG